ncbi:MAG: Hsp20/alpha crystallin family protein [Chloroflexi bacterium]|nr:Hsp20/alpha crystallin family protein [Chloroflexota bacterium]MCL5075951.1 Hsp20/alpha crystallin family protein [Chloroflexota bacterium]
MSITRWEPFRELVSLREAMDRLFEESFIRPPFWPREFAGEQLLTVDMYETPNEIILEAPVPGVKPEDIDISITGNTVCIKGERKAEQEIKREDYIRREQRYGRFYRELTIPTSIQSDKAEATFEHGVLRLHLPKAEEAKPKTIKIKTASK